MRCAMPQATAEMCSRPRSSTFIAVLKPCPGAPPITLAAGTRTFSRITSQVLVPRWPIFLSGLPRVRPGRPRGHDEGGDAARARAVGARHQGEGAGARRVGDEALGAVENVVVAVALAAGLDAPRNPEPASGSVSANDMMSSPVATRGR